MYDNIFINIVLSFLITWIIGLTPPIVIRYLFVDKPLSKSWAIALSALLWFINLVIFISLGSKGTHFALFIVALVSFWILNHGFKPDQPTTSQMPKIRSFVDTNLYLLNVNIGEGLKRLFIVLNIGWTIYIFTIYAFGTIQDSDFLLLIIFPNILLWIIYFLLIWVIRGFSQAIKGNVSNKDQ